MNYDFVNDLEKAKILLDYSWKELADYLGVNYSTLSRWRSEKTFPSDSTIDQIYSKLYSSSIRLNLIQEEAYKDLVQEDSLILFHGSKEGIDGKLSVSFSHDKKDFGKGFYLGESAKQAIAFVSSYKKSCLYFVKLNCIKKLKIKEYDVCKDWMILVAYFRGKIDEYANSKYLQSLLEEIKDTDVIIAPIADNSMYSIINEFIEGSITDLQCINSLSANRLGKQYVVLKDSILENHVELLKKGYLCSLEKETYEKEREIDKNIGKSKMILAKRKYAGKGKYIEEILK